MKRKFLFAAAYLLLTWAASSCEGENCKICKTVTTDSSSGEVTNGIDIEYCGIALVAIEAKGPTTIGNLTTVYECR
jgi:hypothetical protein